MAQNPKVSLSNPLFSVKANRRILAVVENPLEVETLGPVAESLAQKSAGSVQMEFIAQDPLLNQGAEEAVRRRGLEVADIRVPVDLPASLFELDKLKQAVVLRRVSRALRPCVNQYCAVVCGIDSVMARMLVDAANQKGKPTYQVLPSLYLGENASEWRRAFKFVFRYVAGSLLSVPFLKLHQGKSRSGFNRIFVMGERTRESLVEEGVPAKRIEASGVPRFTGLFNTGEADPMTDVPRSEEPRLLFVLGAYRWHGMAEEGRLQEQQLSELVEEATGRNRPHTILVRLHPRGEEPPKWLADYSRVRFLDPARTDIIDNILQADVVVSHRSTALYEAVLAGRPVVRLEFPDHNRHRKPMMEDNLVSVEDTSALLEAVERICESERSYAQVLEQELRSARKVIDPQTPNSAEHIADTILDGLEASGGRTPPRP